MSELLKRCTQCDEVKPWSDFNFTKGRNGNKRPRPECKDCVAFRYLLRKYGITPKQYKKMLKKQKGVCAICFEKKRGTPDRINRLAVDHDHVTGVHRELLCNGCNRLLGFADDRIDILESAIQYLRKHGK